MSVDFSVRGWLLLLAAYLMLSSSSVLGQSDSSSEKEKPLYWDNGLWFSRPRLQLKIGGQAQLDNAGFVSDQEEFALENGGSFFLHFRSREGNELERFDVHRGRPHGRVRTPSGDRISHSQPIKEMAMGPRFFQSFAFNWYPARHARAMFNVIRAKREALEAVWIVQLRLQLAY